MRRKITLDPGENGWWEDSKGHILVAGRPSTFSSKVGEILYYCLAERVGRTLTRTAYEVNLAEEKEELSRRPEFDQYISA